MRRRPAFLDTLVAGGLLLLFAATGCARAPVPTPADRLKAAGEQATRLLQELRRETEDGRYAAALGLADSLIQVAPDLPDAHYMKGLVLMELYQLAVADSAFQQTVALDPYHRGAWYKRGHVAFEEAQYHEAIRRYMRQRDVIEASPEELQAYYRQTDKTALPQTWLQIGRAYQLLNLSDSARWAYEEVLVLDSTHAQAAAWLASLYREEGRTAQALTYMRQAWRHGQGNPDFAYQLGTVLMEDGNLQEALPLFEGVTKVQPWHAGAHYNLGRTLVALGRTDEGQWHLAATDQLQALDQEVNYARAAVARYTNDPARWRVLAEVLGRAGRRDEQQHARAVAKALVQQDVQERLPDTPPEEQQ